MQRLITRVTALVALAFASACNDSALDPLGTTAPVSRVEVQPKVDTLVLRPSPQPTDVVELKAAVVGFSGTVLSEARVRWTTRDPAVVTVDSAGVVRPTGVGTATVVAQAGGKEGRATVVVTALNTALGITPAVTEATVGDTVRFAASATDDTGAPVPGLTIRWTSSNPAVATIDSTTGLARFVAPGAVRFTAASAAGTATTASITVIERRYADVASGYDHTCSVLTSGEAYCWGRGQEGQLGTASLDTLCYDQEDPELRKKRCSLAPKRGETAVRFTRIAAGGLFSCGVSTTQRAYCWGLDTLGQLGGGRLNTTAVPSLVTSIVSFRDISAGATHACALSTTNTAFCWGWDVYGQLGNAGLLFTSSTPIAVDGELRFRQISAGGLHTCGVLQDGRVVCWGANAAGQVGSLEPPTQLLAGTPVYDSPRVIALPGGALAAQVTASQGSHTCALGTSGAAYCWGSNRYGELGNGTTSTTPEAPDPRGRRPGVHAARRRRELHLRRVGGERVLLGAQRLRADGQRSVAAGAADRPGDRADARGSAGRARPEHRPHQRGERHLRRRHGGAPPRLRPRRRRDALLLGLGRDGRPRLAAAAARAAEARPRLAAVLTRLLTRLLARLLTRRLDGAPASHRRVRSRGAVAPPLRRRGGYEVGGAVLAARPQRRSHGPRRVRRGVRPTGALPAPSPGRHPRGPKAQVPRAAAAPFLRPRRNHS
jgi:alpha-tubulin suppressor-like RCC1 family protein